MSAYVIAVCGKGGVGKTTISAILTQVLSQIPAGPSVLAVDADHAGGLTLALGLTPKQTLNHVRLDVAKRLQEGTAAKRALPQTLDYLLLDALEQRGSMGFLAAGRPAERGCYCALNAFVRDAIAALVNQFDVTIVDAEAGVEQMNRDVIANVDHLLLVSDMSIKGLRVAEAVDTAVKALGHHPELGLLLNRVRQPQEIEALRLKTSLPIVGGVPDDDMIRRFDAEENSLPQWLHCPAAQALRDLLASGAWPSLQRLASGMPVDRPS